MPAEERFVDDLETTIAALIEERNRCEPDTARHKFATRQLRGLRYSCEEAGPIIEDLDPIEWGGACRPLSADRSPAA